MKDIVMPTFVNTGHWYKAERIVAPAALGQLILKLDK